MELTATLCPSSVKNNRLPWLQSEDMYDTVLSYGAVDCAAQRWLSPLGFGVVGAAEELLMLMHNNRDHPELQNVFLREETGGGEQPRSVLYRWTSSGHFEAGSGDDETLMRSVMNRAIHQALHNALDRIGDSKTASFLPPLIRRAKRDLNDVFKTSAWMREALLGLEPPPETTSSLSEDVRRAVWRLLDSDQSVKRLYDEGEFSDWRLVLPPETRWLYYDRELKAGLALAKGAKTHHAGKLVRRNLKLTLMRVTVSECDEGDNDADNDKVSHSAQIVETLEGGDLHYRVNRLIHSGELEWFPAEFDHHRREKQPQKRRRPTMGDKQKSSPVTSKGQQERSQRSSQSTSPNAPPPRKSQRVDIGVVEEDQFFTKPEIAEELVDWLISEIGGLDRFDTLLEPSAGRGAFVDALMKRLPRCTRRNLPPRVVAYDTHPGRDGIECVDYFDTPDEPRLGAVLVVGNPPFGKRSQTAIRFIQKACRNPETRTVAFILPNSFNRHSVQDEAFPTQFHLRCARSVAPDAFDGDSGFYARCTFQVWERRQLDEPRAIETEKVPLLFDYTTNAGDACISVGKLGAKRVGVARTPPDPKATTTTHYFIECDLLDDDPLRAKKLKVVVELLNEREWPLNTSIGADSINRQQLTPVIDAVLVQVIHSDF